MDTPTLNTELPEEELDPCIRAATEPLTCGLQEAAAMTGLSYDYLMGQSKVLNPKERIPGFKVGKSGYRVIVSELPAWLNRKAGLA